MTQVRNEGIGCLASRRSFLDLMTNPPDPPQETMGDLENLTLADLRQRIRMAELPHLRHRRQVPRITLPLDTPAELAFLPALVAVLRTATLCQLF